MIFVLDEVAGLKRDDIQEEVPTEVLGNNEIVSSVYWKLGMGT